MDRDQILARIARRRASVERANAEDREAFRALSMEQRGEELRAACEAALAIVRARADREEVERLLWQSEPPHPSDFALKERLRQEAQSQPRLRK